MSQHIQNKISITSLPKRVLEVLKKLQDANFESYIVGGSVRDLLLGQPPKDWDITTNATPKEIISLFDKTVYENNYGTVSVIFEDETEMSLRHIEVTPYRIESEYSDKRHPDNVLFSEKIEDDLKRRDFTINAIAYSIKDNGELVDLFDGIKDIDKGHIQTVGDANERFQEDALRMLRAIRFAVTLRTPDNKSFVISSEISSALVEHASSIAQISAERIRDEFIKIITSPEPAVGINMLEKFGLLTHIIPELREGINCIQGGAHRYDVYAHLLQALQHAADKNWPLEIRLAALFHDIGKPRSRRPGVKKAYTFYGHEVIGARMTTKIMERMKFPKKTIDLVVTLVRQHMFFSDTETITLSAVRRVVAKVGKENIWTLMNVRECDRVGMAKKEAPYRLRKYHAMIEEVLRDPISVGALAIDGIVLKDELGITPGPRMGWILHALLEEVLDDPTKNTREHLSELVASLNMLGDAELRALGERGKGKKDELEEKEVGELHKKHGV
jgi:poly(A) polymerase/tRNA nucleotidyltransferase (CCA-adding enzyme)